MSEMENIWDVINSRLNTIEKNNGKHEDKAIETIKNETLRKKKPEKVDKTPVRCGTIFMSNIVVIGVLILAVGEQRKTYIWRHNGQNFSKLVENYKLTNSRSSKKPNHEETTLRHITIKLI